MSYIITVAVNIAIFALLALSLNIITGYAGQSAMGHAAFFGIGAYTAALITNAGISFWPVSYTHLDVYKRQRKYSAD